MKIKFLVIIVLVLLLTGCTEKNNEEYRTEISDDFVIEREIEYFAFDVGNLTIFTTEIIIDEGGYRNWPFDGYPEIIQLEIDYQNVMDELKEIISLIEGRQVCSIGSLGCVLYGPMPAFNITIGDGSNTYILSIEVSDTDVGQAISRINIMEGHSTLTTIASIDLSEDYAALYEAIDNAYQDYLTSTE